MDRAVTLLPQPLSPTRQTVSPMPIVREMPSTARAASAPRPKSTCKSLISSKFMVLESGFGVGRVPQAITQKVKRQHRDENGRTGCKQPRVAFEVFGVLRGVQ